jgi:hypothetical protein
MAKLGFQWKPPLGDHITCSRQASEPSNAVSQQGSHALFLATTAGEEKIEGCYCHMCQLRGNAKNGFNGVQISSYFCLKN